ncbi:DHH family phosphoesterase [Helicobacter bizzozeronii]|uniref:DHH family phosphoesterase n=1 Tax=Helicobacter bizzozeronii TaxID=56877 RepID=UPI0018F7E8FD|nr:DHH family phosphoesterase [Helicobacter bizzozeronii]
MLAEFQAHIEKISQEDGKHKFSLDDVLLMGDGLKALELLHKAIQNQQQIILVGDYDCDGMSGTALVLYFFREVLGYPLVHYIIPRRNVDSYAVSVPLLEEYATKRRLVGGVYVAGGIKGGQELNLDNSLFLTIDNGAGISDEVHAMLQSYQSTLILSDHHEFLEGRVPKCDAFVHPLLSDQHNFKGISGACVAYLLVLAYAKHYQIKMRLDHLHYMQILAGISTIGDLMDLSMPYNRQLVQRMDANLKKSMPANLAQLYALSPYKNPYKLATLAWDVIPLINAVGRLDGIEGFCHCNLVVDFLSQNTPNAHYAQLLLETNQRRKELVTQIKQSLQIVRQKRLFHAGGAVPRGILGVIANQILEQGCLLALCWRYQGTEIEASLRSKEPDLIALLAGMKQAGIGVSGGGHKLACGVVFEGMGDFQKGLEFLDHGML